MENETNRQKNQENCKKYCEESKKKENQTGKKFANENSGYKEMKVIIIIINNYNY